MAKYYEHQITNYCINSILFIYFIFFNVTYVDKISFIGLSLNTNINIFKQFVFQQTNQYNLYRIPIYY